MNVAVVVVVVVVDDCEDGGDEREQRERNSPKVITCASKNTLGGVVGGNVTIMSYVALRPEAQSQFVVGCRLNVLSLCICVRGLAVTLWNRFGKPHGAKGKNGFCIPKQ